MNFTMLTLPELAEALPDILGDDLLSCSIRLEELTCEVKPESIFNVCQILCNHAQTQFSQLIDLCGVDYAHYGLTEEGETTGSGWQGGELAVVYHLQSIPFNNRIRIRAGLEGNQPRVASVIDVWPVANWFEREAFDLYGIIFTGHPDLRRLLTDYGFIGHPFRKDFPLSGQVEMRYDETQGRVIYQPVTVEKRILVPRIIRKDGFATEHQEET